MQTVKTAAAMITAHDSRREDATCGTKRRKKRLNFVTVTGQRAAVYTNVQQIYMLVQYYHLLSVRTSRYPAPRRPKPWYNTNINEVCSLNWSEKNDALHHWLPVAHCRRTRNTTKTPRDRQRRHRRAAATGQICVWNAPWQGARAPYAAAAAMVIMVIFSYLSGAATAAAAALCRWSHARRPTDAHSGSENENEIVIKLFGVRPKAARRNISC